ncbi:MAG: signal peptide peptidase SppA [Deltaproteobacteria bacterium]|nr:MAG: signal peptide peptidase SppA [Deltaproteobacteria bacterium]TNF31404.1 MAG: signal peptide peptidase SppA [Deltaproteobacteria bacterium]
MAENKNRAVYGVLVMVFLFFLILMIFASYTIKVFNSENDALNSLSKGKGQIAVVEVNGVIMEARPTIELLLRAEEDENIKAVILRINSPGGAVGPTQEIFEEIRRIDGAWDASKGKEGKPIFGSFGSIAASGGYYLGAATRRIYASPGTLTGSIGVIMQFMDASKLIELTKVKPMNIKAGKYKDIGAPTKTMSMEEEGLLNGMVQGVHQQFIRDILLLRKKKIKGSLIDHAQGQIFSGEDAWKLGLVDELASMWSAGRQIHKELNLKGKFGLKYVVKKKKMSVMDILENLDEATSNINFVSWFKGVPLLMAK